MPLGGNSKNNAESGKGNSASENRRGQNASPSKFNTSGRRAKRNIQSLGGIIPNSQKSKNSLVIFQDVVANSSNFISVLERGLSNLG